MKTFYTLALAASLAFVTTSAFAVNICQSRTLDGGQTIIDGGTEQQDVFGDVTRTLVVGQTKGGPAHNGNSYTQSTFCPVGAAAGTCTGETLIESVAAPIYGDVTTNEKVGEVTVDLPDTVIDNPDIPQYRIGVMIPATQWTPGGWVGTNWKNGSCP